MTICAILAKIWLYTWCSQLRFLRAILNSCYCKLNWIRIFCNGHNKKGNWSKMEKRNAVFVVQSNNFKGFSVWFYLTPSPMINLLGFFHSSKGNRILLLNIINIFQPCLHNYPTSEWRIARHLLRSFISPWWYSCRNEYRFGLGCVILQLLFRIGFRSFHQKADAPVNPPPSLTVRLLFLAVGLHIHGLDGDDLIRLPASSSHSPAPPSHHSFLAFQGYPAVCPPASILIISFFL